MYSYDPYAMLNPASKKQNYNIQDIESQCNQNAARVGTRNLFTGRVVKITPGAVNSIVVVNIGSGNLITAVVTMESLKDLGISEGSVVTAVINPSDVILMA